MRILLVEDDQGVAKAMSSLLRSMGHTVIHAINMTDAKQKFLVEQPDVVFTDNSFPETAGGSEIDDQGIELIKHIRASAWKNTPIIWFSGRPKPAGEVTKAGADYVFGKPVEDTEIEAALKEIAARSPGK